MTPTITNGIIATMNTEAITVRMSKDLKTKLEQAVGHKRSQNSIIIEALTEFLK